MPVLIGSRDVRTAAPGYHARLTYASMGKRSIRRDGGVLCIIVCLFAVFLSFGS